MTPCTLVWLLLYFTLMFKSQNNELFCCCRSVWRRVSEHFKYKVFGFSEWQAQTSGSVQTINPGDLQHVLRFDLCPSAHFILLNKDNSPTLLYAQLLHTEFTEGMFARCSSVPTPFYILSAFQQITHKIWGYAAIKPVQNDVFYGLCKTTQRLGWWSASTEQHLTRGLPPSSVVYWIWSWTRLWLKPW